MTMPDEIDQYHHKLSPTDRLICASLRSHIDAELTEAESKIWHAHPVWFLDGNPIVGYSRAKGGIRLMFWSGKSFDEEALQRKGKFKDASVRYADVSQIDTAALRRWLQRSRDIQWDYKNIVKRKGVLERLV